MSAATVRRRWLPTPAEAGILRFLLPGSWFGASRVELPPLPAGGGEPGTTAAENADAAESPQRTAAQLHTFRSQPVLVRRFAASAALFIVGLALWFLVPVVGVVGLLLILAGHLPLWVKTQRNAPGGATPQHEEVWAPTEEDWIERIQGLERRAASWDATPWDISNLRGCGAFGVALVALLACSMAFGTGLAIWLPGAGAVAVGKLLPAALALVVPLWFNGIRTLWHPSELRLKGEALAIAQRVAARAGDFDLVPMLALREGQRGKYPVDARLMLRPAAGGAGAGPQAADGADAAAADERFLGVQIQVAINSVQGKDYPYLYCVVLGKQGFKLPMHRRRQPPGMRVVYERGASEGVVYLVIRQHADRQGGWHTEKAAIRELIELAIEEGRYVQEVNRRQGDEA